MSAVFCAALSRSAFFSASTPDARGAVDAAAVVAYLDQYLVSGLARADGEAAGCGLARGFPLRGALDSMVDRVADDVGERIADHLDHLAVELDVAPVYVENHLLPRLGGEVADHPRQRREEVVDPLHSGAGDRVAHLGDGRGDALEHGLHLHSGRRFPEAAGKLVAGEDEVGNPAHHPVEQVDGKPDRSHRRTAVLGGGLAVDPVLLGLRLGQGLDERAVILARQGLARLQSLYELADPVDDGEDCADQLMVGDPLARPDRRQRVLGGVAQRLEARQVEEAAIALDGMDEAEDGIEPLAILRRGLPGDDLAAQRVDHLAAFRYEFVDQIVHRARRSCMRRALWGEFG
jgi:hypothetical protein